MNILAQHIRVLLLEHSHVALPRFGTFYTERTESHLTDDDVFVPVRRSVGFTSEIDDGDTLLLTSIRQTYKLNEEQAMSRLDSYINEAGQTLAVYGVLDFDILGSFNLSGAQITFSPCKAGLVVPEYFGLDAFSMPKLPVLADAKHKHKSAKSASTASSYVIRINRKVVHYAASVAAAVLLFFLFNTPLGDHKAASKIGTEISGMFIPYVNRPDLDAYTDYKEMQLQPQEQKQLQEQEEAVAEAVGKDTQHQDVKSKSEEAQRAPQVQSDHKQQPASADNLAAKAKFTVVLASSVSERGAEDLVLRLSKAGFDKASVLKRGDMVRVVYDSYPTEGEAYAAAAKLGRHKEMTGAWVMKL